MIATGRCGGQIGEVSVSGRFIRVTVHSDGLTLRPFGRGDYTIRGREIVSISDGGGSLWLRKVVIEHTAPGKASPIVLVSPSDGLLSAVMRIERSPAVVLAGPPVPDTPTGRGMRNFAWNVASLTYFGGLLTFLLTLGFLVVDLIRAPRGDLLSLATICIGFCGTVMFAKALRRNERQR